MYEHYYRLHEKPFALIPDPKYLFPGGHHREAIDFLTHSVEHHARCITMTGEIGSGKTVVLRSFLKGLGPDFHVVQISYPFGDTIELLLTLLEKQTPIPSASDFNGLCEELASHIGDLRSAGKRPLIAFDEAQHLGRDTLMDILKLSEGQLTGGKPVQVILCGQRILRETLCSLDTPSSENCRYYHLRSLPEEAVPLYIKFRLSVGGCTEPGIFSEEVMSEITRISGGIPRIINTLCDALLVQGYLQNRRVITPSLLRDIPISFCSSPRPDDQDAQNEADRSSRETKYSLSPLERDEDSRTDSAQDTTRGNGSHEAVPGDDARKQEVDGGLELNVLVFEKNARMRMHMENQMAALGHTYAITDDIESVCSHLERRGSNEFSVLVADAGYFYSAGAKESLSGMSALDHIQEAFPDVPIVMTSVLPLTALRKTLFQRGVSLLLQKPDVQHLEPSRMQVQLNLFFDELLACLRSIYAQFRAFHSRAVKMVCKNTDTIM